MFSPLSAGFLLNWITQQQIDQISMKPVVRTGHRRQKNPLHWCVDSAKGADLMNLFTLINIYFLHLHKFSWEKWMDVDEKRHVGPISVSLCSFFNRWSPQSQQVRSVCPTPPLLTPQGLSSYNVCSELKNLFCVSRRCNLKRLSNKRGRLTLLISAPPSDLWGQTAY